MTSAGVRGRPQEHIGFLVWFSLLGLMFIGLAAVVLKFPFFYYRSIEISGESHVSRADLLADLRAYPLKNVFGRFLGFDHFFVWGSSSIALPELVLSRVEVSRDFARRVLRVSVTDRERALVWCGAENACAWVDPMGIAFQYAPFADGQLITSISEDGALPPLGAAVLPGNQFMRLQRVIEIVQGAGLMVEHIVFDRNLLEVTVTARNAPTLAFSLRFDSAFAATALSVLSGRKDFRNINVVDFRVEQKAYYKMK
ncbi:MAG: hypothetical protein Q7R85_00520 [bacterium]|nr:hypothetical protein [bacterium]